MIIHSASQSVVLKAVDPFAIRSLLPKHSKTIDVAGYNIAVKHTVDSTRLLRNLGYSVPSPILTDYKWPGKHTPFDHQQVMADMMTVHPKVFNLSEMGTGKTYASLWAADWLMHQGLVHKALILAPLSTLDTVWKQDIFDILMHRTVNVLHGSLERRMERLAMDVDFYILNHDGISITQLAKEIHRRKDIDLVILDEASMFRNASTTKWRFLKWVIENKPRLWQVTGTPCPNEPTDAWALAKLANPNRGPQYFGQFKRQTMMQVSTHKWVPKAGAIEAAYHLMQPAVRFKKADCLTLPPVVTLNRQTRLTKAQRDAYEQMREQMILDAQAGPISAVNAADQINKLRQILCGCVKHPDTGTYSTIDHRYRVADLIDAIDEASAKVIIIVPFKGIINELAIELEKRYTVGLLNGDVSAGARTKIIQAFKTQPDPHVLLCHPKVMAHGLNLTEADTTIFYAPIYSGDEYQQVIERFNRTGQTRHMSIVRLAAHPLEWDIYKAVDNRQITQSTILDLYKSVTE